MSRAKTLSGAKLILPQLILAESTPNAVAILFGGNDSSLAGLEPPLHVPFDDNITVI